MRGTKRFAASDSSKDTNDSAPLFQNKRIMEGSPFDAHRAVSSQQQLHVAPTLDLKRAELSRQHVRALNAQFASWVQSQLKNHPDELWDDGVGDYITHSSNIKENFSDIVSWLIANNASREKSSASPFNNTENKAGSEIKNAENKYSHGFSGFVPVSNSASFAVGNSPAISTTAGTATSFSQASKTSITSIAPFGSKLSFTPTVTNSSFNSAGTSISVAFAGTPALFTSASSSSSFALPSSTGSFSPAVTSSSFTPMSTPAVGSWASGVFSSTQTPVSFGIQSSVPVSSNAADDADEDNELPRPSSPSVEKFEEKGVVMVHEVKCKLYVKSTDPADKDTWKDKGTGQLSIKCKEGISKATKESKPTIVVHNEVGKVLLNAFLYPGIKTNAQKNSLVTILHTSDSSANDDTVVARTFLIRLKTVEDRDKLAAAIQEYAPAS